jgi:hypothetical protein
MKLPIRRHIQAQRALKPGPVRGALRVGLALSLAFTALAVTFALHPTIALAYSCGTTSTGPHCYGEYYWTTSSFGTSRIGGASVSIETVQMTCSIPACTNTPGFVDNEVWLDGTSCGCSVEAGYATYTNVGGSYMAYFYANQQSCCAYDETVLANVPSGDLNTYPSYIITQASSTYYDVDIDTPNLHYGYSVPNNMQANRIDEGQELAGNGGASAALANYLYSEWVDTSGFGHYETDNGIWLHPDPPYDDYTAGSNGGVLQTTCC